MPRSSPEDGELWLVRTLRDQMTGATVPQVEPARPKVVGMLPMMPEMKDEVVRRAAELGIDEQQVRAWLLPFPERRDVEGWSEEFARMFREVKSAFDERETKEEFLVRVGQTLQGVVVTRDSGYVHAHYRVPEEAPGIDKPLLMLFNTSWLMEFLDEMRQKLVDECRARGRSWADVAQALGVTRASAWERYSSPDD